MLTAITALVSFGLPALAGHFGVGLIAPVIASMVGKRAAVAVATVGAKAAGKTAAAGVKGIIQHIANGGQVTDEQRAWLETHRQELYLPPKYDPATAGPDTWTVPKAT